MKIYNEISIKELNKIKEEEAKRGNAVESLASELAMEKVKSMQKDIIVQNVTSEVALLKIEVMKLKGGM